MPPSQLKRLKTSLREQGITGASKSSKQKKASSKARTTSDRIHRNAALQQIRDSFNPFEIKAPSRRDKFQHVTVNGAGKGGKYKEVLHRPGVTKSAGEEMRRATLLPEMQRRNKVGALVDRRIGEDDPGITAEERAVQRFAQEKQRRKGASVFNLEASDEDERGFGLTHGGRNLDDLPADDFGDGGSTGDDSEDGGLVRRKRRRSDGSDGDQEVDGEEDAVEQPERKRSKKEVMEEVIAKSKLHKYERQKAKDDDDDLREELDIGTQDLLALLQGHKAPSKPPSDLQKEPEPATSGNEPVMNPDRQRLLDGMHRDKADKEYDARLKQLTQDTRAKPSERTKTEEEKVREEAERLKDLEERRVMRMRGEEVEDDEEDRAKNNGVSDDDDDDPDEAAEFGLTSSNPLSGKEKHVVLEDEDEFALDEDLIASGSEVDLDNESASEEDSDVEDGAQEDHEDEEDEFVRDILGKEHSAAVNINGGRGLVSGTRLAYTYPCPRSHSELLDVIRDTAAEQLPAIIQRIRALHHPSLSATNKEGMADFSTVLVDHLSHMGVEKQPLAVAEQVVRHLHSLSRTYPETIANGFRKHLQSAHERKDLHAGDLMILTAIGSIYPTSDQFHQVVTPAMTLMARWLAVNMPDSMQKHATGALLVALCLKYQRLSKRYVPEAIRFTLRSLSPKSALSQDPEKIDVENLLTMADLWKDKSAFPEIFSPALRLLQNPNTKPSLRTLSILIQSSRLCRRPLELHNHRPLPIRTSIPKFEESFHPDKHYDPDKERSEARKLQKEYKRERKGALRELRKDASFVARVQLGEKRAKDAEYERKYRRLVAEVQGQEGHEGRVYEREKDKRGRMGKKGRR